MPRLSDYSRAPMQDQPTLLDQFNEWLENTGYRLPPCPISQGKNWAVAQHIVEFHQYTDGRFILPGPPEEKHHLSGGSVYPAIMIVCQDCGYTMFINAVLIGVV